MGGRGGGGEAGDKVWLVPGSEGTLPACGPCSGGPAVRCVCVCMRACVRVCVCLYLSHRLLLLYKHTPPESLLGSLGRLVKHVAGGDVSWDSLETRGEISGILRATPGGVLVGEGGGGGRIVGGLVGRHCWVHLP